MDNKTNPLKLSIVIPVYNAELYVEKCLRSCAEQDIPSSDYEIIVVNDGAKDNSLVIIEQVAKEYSNITVVSQKNAGPGSSRNKGLFLATGEYVWFIDSDDWIEANCLKKIINVLYENCLDCLIIGISEIYNGIQLRRQGYSILDKNIFAGIELLKMNYWSVPIFFTIFRRDFIDKNSLKFMEGIFLGEDSEFASKAYYFAKQIAMIDDLIYYVYPNPCSITRSFSQKKAFDCIKVAKSLSIFSKIVKKDLRYLYYNIISVIINNSMYNSYQINNDAIKSLSLELKENKTLFKYLRRSTIIKYRLEGMIFHIFPNNCVQIYKFLQLFNKNHYK